MDASFAAMRERFLQTGDDAEMPMIDAHHHFWDVERNYHPWLRDFPRIPFRYGDYSAICRNFLPADYFAGAAPHRVVATVMMEGEWDSRDPVGEAKWANALHASAGFPNAMAGQIWLDREDLDEVLAVYETLPLVRSVRHKPAVVSRERYTSAFAASGSMRCDRWRRGYACLSRAGLIFELQAPWWHFGEACELARDFPDVTIIVNHTGLPADRSEEGLIGWRKAMARLADYPNVWLKISGLGEPGIAWSPERNGPVVHDAIKIFGAERCMFASNFPVDGVITTLSVIFDGFKAIVGSYPPASRLKLFFDNAATLYLQKDAN